MSANPQEQESPALRWRFESLPFEKVAPRVMANEHALFYFIVTASFVEITTDIYTRNLIDYFAGDGEICEWLAAGWEPEEMQHGRALRRYIGAAWPNFDWDKTYSDFLAEYRECCQTEFLGPTRALEMARRCIVETGTCSYYTMIRNLSPCPVLAELANNVRTDEAGHYRHFHGYFKRYREAERPSRGAIANALWGRIREIDGEDGEIAFKHVWLANNPHRPFEHRYYRHFTRVVRAHAVKHYPFRMAAHMMTQPLGFGLKTQRRTSATLAGTARFLSRISGTTALS
jgi:hypothetical protein